MQYQELVQIRKEKGLAIASTKKVRQEGKYWLVPSQSRNADYRVELTLTGATCTCPDYTKRGIRCKHVWAVEYTIEKHLNEDGTTTITQTKRITYPQNWSAYTKAQNEEVRLFDELLKDLVQNVPEPTQAMGRPRIPLKEAIFCSIQKVYSGLSSRRAHSLYQFAEQRNLIAKAPNYNTINLTLNRPELTPILHELLAISAMPLRSIETTFAIDSTGFRTNRFSEYASDKYGTPKEHKWVKLHGVCGTTTNVICAVSMSGNNSGDSPQLEPLIRETAKAGFQIKEVVADSAYASRRNYEVIDELGGTGYIPFRAYTSGKARGSLVWKKAFLFFQNHEAEFMEHYHKRSNVETTFMAIKTKFGDTLKSKNEVAQVNELLCKLIAYNLSVVIAEMFNLGITPTFLS
jgi:transposase/predicted nucleic acid-binding Zn finger protein